MTILLLGVGGVLTALAGGSCVIAEISLMANWDRILMEGSAMAGAIFQAFERMEWYYKDKGMRWQ